MKNSIRLMQKEMFNSAMQISKDFDKFSNVFTKEFEKLLKSVKAYEIDIKQNYFYINGYFMHNKDIYFFSTGDVRKRKEMYIERQYSDKIKEKMGFYIPMIDSEDFIIRFKEILRIGV